MKRTWFREWKWFIYWLVTNKPHPDHVAVCRKEIEEEFRTRRTK